MRVQVQDYFKVSLGFIFFDEIKNAFIFKKNALAFVFLLAGGVCHAAGLNTKLPPVVDSTNMVSLHDVDLPAAPLAASLKKYEELSHLSIKFDNNQVLGKTAPVVKGRFTHQEALLQLLAGTDLEAEFTSGVVLIKQAKTTRNDIPNITLDTTQVRAKRFYEIGPMPGLALTKEEIPGNVQSITSKEIKESHALSLTDLMNSKLQSVNVNDYQSNPFQMDVTYRGFTASPQLGTAQGLSVFIDGIRVNEPFGDVVNWDMIPLNAVSTLDVFPGSNPIFGLGTLGGAIALRTKSGFTDVGGSAEVLTGSFGRKQLQGYWGGNNGNLAGFVSANIFDEDGWRKNSGSAVNQVFAKGEWRNDKLQLGLVTLYAGNDLIGNGLLPAEQIIKDPSQVFTSPDETKNRLLQFQLTGLWDVTDEFNISAQIYRRKSKRNSSTGDFNSDFAGISTRKPKPGEKIAGGYADVNKDGLPDYTGGGACNIAADQYGLMLDRNGQSVATNLVFDSEGNFVSADLNPNFDANNLAIGTNASTKAVVNQATLTSPTDPKLHQLAWACNTLNPQVIANEKLPDAYYQFALKSWNSNELIQQRNLYADTDPRSSYLFATIDTHNIPDSRPANRWFFTVDGDYQMSFTDEKGFYHQITVNDPILANPYLLATADVGFRLGKPLILPNIDNASQTALNRDGAREGATGTGPGVIEGTPIGLITKTDIDQLSDGGAIQFNWNFPKHKLMVGSSIDMAESTYTSSQQVALIDATHLVYADPQNIGDEYAARDHGIGLNNFAGNSETKSLYASETWSPIETLHINAAARYNDTTIHNKLDVNNIVGLRGVSSFLNFWKQAVLCTGTLPDGTPDPNSCPPDTQVPFTIERANGLGAIAPGDAETFHYHSLNPSFGAAWQMNPATNVYANWSQGARTPSVIELGCGYDDTLINVVTDPNQKPFYRPKSLLERRFCSLPSIMSGDPYLPQVVSQTTEVGARGYWGADIEWNASVYRSDLQDDIYFVAVEPTRNFFKSIGQTRRQGLEMGVKGKTGKTTFKVNYSLTDATFESSFLLDSPYNSSAGTTRVAYDPLIGNSVPQIPNYQQIQVTPGDRMPGVPLHNLNASVNYDITEQWNIGLSMVMHSDAYVRGNENNKHQAGPLEPYQIFDGDTKTYTKIPRPDARYGGKTPGYAVFNFQTSYKVAPEWTLGLQVSNIFDRQYQTAGRLGINPFSPSINGVIGPSGFNYNSNDWRSSTFLGPGAPRAAWISLTYDFDVNR